MASGMAAVRKEKASTAGWKETSSEKEADKNPFQTEDETSSESEAGLQIDYDEDDDENEDEDEDEVEAVISEKGSAAAVSGNCAVISVLFETPSGFAIFGYEAAKLTRPEAWKHIWADFLNVPKAIVWLKAFQTFEDKAHAINVSAVSPELTTMIRKYVVNGQTLAVGNEHYKNVIQLHLGIPCLYNTPVKELMWGLTIQMRRLVPMETSELTNEDRFPMSEGMRHLLNYHKFEVHLNMMVTRRIIEMAGIMYECDRCVDRYNNSLRFAAKHLKKISHIDTHDWDLLKLAAAFKMICYPEEKMPAARRLFRKHQLKTFMNDAPRYEDKISKITCLEVYNEIYSLRKNRLETARMLVRLVRRAKKAYEAEQAGKAAGDLEIRPDRKICHGIIGMNPVMIDELDEWHTTLSAKRKEIQVPPTLAPVDALERYTQISSHPLSMMNRPGILSMDIHPSKDIVATGGIDSNAVLFDRSSCQILCTLTGHSKKITSLKFVNRNELFITGSADKTVRIWQGSKDENYSCIHTLKDHAAEVEAVTVHASQKYFVTASRDNSWRFYDISTGSCLTQGIETSGQEGYTSAAFHPDGLILGTGTAGAVVEIWDVKTQSKVTNIGWHVGPVTAMSFSENGFLLATAAKDGVKLWDLRNYRHLMTLSPYNSDTPTNAVEFDFSGSYLAIGGSDIRVYKVSSDFTDWNVIKTLPDPSGTGKVTSMKFGADATYIAVGSMDQNLRIFGLQSYQPAM